MPEGGAILLTVGLVDLAHGIERAVFGLDLALHGGHGQLQLLLVLAGDADDFRDELMIAFRKIGAFIVFQQILEGLEEPEHPDDPAEAEEPQHGALLQLPGHPKH